MDVRFRDRILGRFDILLSVQMNVTSHHVLCTALCLGRMKTIKPADYVLWFAESNLCVKFWARDLPYRNSNRSFVVTVKIYGDNTSAFRSFATVGNRVLSRLVIREKQPYTASHFIGCPSVIIARLRKSYGNNLFVTCFFAIRSDDCARAVREPAWCHAVHPAWNHAQECSPIARILS